MAFLQVIEFRMAANLHIVLPLLANSQSGRGLTVTHSIRINFLADLLEFVEFSTAQELVSFIYMIFHGLVGVFVDYSVGLLSEVVISWEIALKQYDSAFAI